MKNFMTYTYEVHNPGQNTIARGEFRVAFDTNHHPSILRGDIRHKAQQLAEIFWNGKDTICSIPTAEFGEIKYTHSEEI